MIYTTLNRIRKHSPCADGWGKLLAHLGKTGADDEPLAYSVILEAVGLDDALWYLRAEPQHASIWRMYAVRCARRVQHLMTDERSIRALDVAERHARGAAKDSELAAARAAAWAAVWDAVWAAARAAAGAAWAAARDAAWDAAWDAAEDAIRADFERMLAAHHAMPGESCALVDWWSLETTLAASHLPAEWRIEAHEEAAEALKKEREAHAETNRAMTNALLMMEEREQRDEALLRQALERLEAVVGHFDPYMGDNECRPMENARITIAILRDRLWKKI